MHLRKQSEISFLSDDYVNNKENSFRKVSGLGMIGSFTLQMPHDV